MLELRGVTRDKTPPVEYAAKRLQQAVSGIGGNPYVGTPDRVAEQLANLARGGVRGIAVSFVNYLNDVPYFCAEVLPRLARWDCGDATDGQQLSGELRHPGGGPALGYRVSCSSSACLAHASASASKL